VADKPRALRGHGALPWSRWARTGKEKFNMSSSTTSSSKVSKASEVAQATQLIAGVNKNLATTQSFTVAGTAYMPAQVTTDLQEIVTLITDVDTAKSVVQAKLARANAQLPALRVVMAALIAYVKLTWGNSPDVLATFGLPPKKAAAKPSTVTKVVAVAKRASTRKARGTTSKKAKMAIKGNVADVVLTTIETQPVATPSPSPSAPASVTVTGTSRAT
jgi:hypothetical protein